MSHTVGTAIPVADIASDQAIVVGQGRRRHPAPDGQIPGMTPRRGQTIQESHPCQVTGANPARGQPQAGHHEHLQAVHCLRGGPEVLNWLDPCGDLTQASNSVDGESQVF